MDLAPGTASWVEESVGGRISTVARLTGGITAGMYRVQFADGRMAVLRRWDTADAAGLVRREAHALQSLVKTSIPAPRLIASDPLGADAGVPALLMSLVPGEVDLTPTDFDGWLHELASTLVAIHTTDIAAEPYEPWLPPTVPAWATGDKLWIRAFETAQMLTDAAPGVFLHRDFQHFNVLWQNGRVRGVVDWPNAGTGPRGIDVGHCRLNLAVLYSADAAEQFLEIYSARAGHTVDPRADVAALCSFGPDWPNFIPRQVAGRTPVDRTGMRKRVEDVLTQALRRL